MTRILFDNGTPRGVTTALVLRNGELLTAAEIAGFDVLLTTDRNIRYQQNLAGRRLAVVVLSKGRASRQDGDRHDSWSIRIRTVLRYVCAEVDAERR